MDQLIALTDELTRRLLFSSLQAVLLFALLGLLIRRLPQMGAATRTWLWWLLGLQLLFGLLQPLQWSIPLPAWRAQDTAAPMQTWVQYSQQTDGPGLLHTEVITRPREVPSNMAPPPPTHWSLLLGTLWLLGVMLQLVLHARAWREGRQLWRHATPLDDPAQLAELARLAGQLGLRRRPRLRQSDAIGSPQVMGLWRPTVLLPTQATLSPAELSLALCHELVHLRRGDLYLGWIPALAQLLFFFHPLVRRAVREYALQREAACDAQVLARDAHAAQAYGRLLLRLGVQTPLAHGLAHASSTYDNLKRRLTMLQSQTHPTLHGWRSGLLLAGIALIGVLPWRVSADPAQAEAAPAVPSMPPTPPAPPAPIAPPAGWLAQQGQFNSLTRQTHGVYVVFQGGDQGEHSLQLARDRGGNRLPSLWFQQDGKAYLIRQASYLQRFDAINAPSEKLAGQQAQLAGRQQQLAEQQARLSDEFARLAGQTGADVSARRKTLDAQQAKLAAQQQSLGRQQIELGRQQHALSSQSRQQLRALLTDAIKQGAAVSQPASAVGIGQLTTPPTPPTPPRPPAPARPAAPPAPPAPMPVPAAAALPPSAPVPPIAPAVAAMPAKELSAAPSPPAAPAGRPAAESAVNFSTSELHTHQLALQNLPHGDVSVAVLNDTAILLSGDRDDLVIARDWRQHHLQQPAVLYRQGGQRWLITDTGVLQQVEPYADGQLAATRRWSKSSLLSDPSLRKLLADTVSRGKAVLLAG